MEERGAHNKMPPIRWAWETVVEAIHKRTAIQHMSQIHVGVSSEHGYRSIDNPEDVRHFSFLECSMPITFSLDGLHPSASATNHQACQSYEHDDQQEANAIIVGEAFVSREALEQR